MKITKKIIVLAIFTLLLTINVLAADIKKTTISADMHCKSCQNNIEKTLKNSEGVKKVKTDFKEQLVKVEFDNEIIKEDEIVKIINNLGYKASVYSKDKENKK